jgi:hypothetical protein
MIFFYSLMSDASWNTILYGNVLKKMLPRMVVMSLNPWYYYSSHTGIVYLPFQDGIRHIPEEQTLLLGNLFHTWGVE